jgi:hypothetical protein
MTLAQPFAEQLAGGAVDEVQARAGRARHGDVCVGGISGNGGNPVLYVHARRRALEDNLTFHVRQYDRAMTLEKLRMFT